MIINICSIAAVLSIALLYAAKAPVLRMAGLIICVGSFLLGFLVWKIGWKCPHCGKHLGRIGQSDLCPHCGKNIYE